MFSLFAQSIYRGSKFSIWHGSKTLFSIQVSFIFIQRVCTAGVYFPAKRNLVFLQGNFPNFKLIFVPTAFITSVWRSCI